MQNWLDVAMNGLPALDGPRKKVLILGAGVAGLIAAHELRKQGHDPLVLEARSRPGGRVYTMREPFATGLHAEAGAMRIPISHDLTLHYLQEFGLELYPFTLANPQAYYYLQGQKIRRADALKDPGVLPYHLSEKEHGKTVQQMWSETVQPFLDKVKAGGAEAWAEIVETQDWLSLRDFLEMKGWSEEAIELFGLLENEEAEMNFSVLEILREEIAGCYSNLYQIKGGTDQLTNSLFERVRRHVRLGAVVRAIDQDPDSVIVHYDTPRGRFSERADYMICTIPFAVMRHMEILQPFSRPKQQAIRELHYHASGKVFLQCRRRFWEEDEGVVGGGTITDLPIRNMFYPEHGRETGRGVLLASYTWAQDAERWSALSPDARIDQAIEHVSKIHPQILKECEGGASMMWQDDPYAGGAYALFEPGQETRLYQAIVAPEGRIHFAGEHTTRMHAWIQGSIESGLRAAWEVNEA